MIWINTHTLGSHAKDTQTGKTLKKGTKVLRIMANKGSDYFALHFDMKSVPRLIKHLQGLLDQ